MFKFVIAFLSVFFMLPLNSYAAEKLTIASLFEFEPFSWHDGNRALGTDIDITREAAKRVGFDVEFKMVPWKRVLSLVRLGKVNAGLPAFRRPEREAYAHYTNIPLHVSRYNAFTVKGKPFVYKNTESFFGLKVAKIRGFAVTEKFDAAYQNNKIAVTETNDIKRALQMLERGVVDVFVNNDLPTLYQAKLLGFSDRITINFPPVNKGEGAFLIFSKAKHGEAGKDLARKFNDALKLMADDGTTQKIIDSYIQ